MAQVNSGIRAVLARPAVYDAFQRLVGADRMRGEIVRTYLRPWAGARVLDIGCGTAAILEQMPPVDYVGLDLSEDYISTANARYAGRGRFLVSDVASLASRIDDRFDLVLASGLLHHLDDDAAAALLADVRGLLAAGGRVVTVDGSWAPGQSPVARFLLSRDRGRNVRTAEGYMALARQSFDRVSAALRHDVLRIPFTLCFLECSQAPAAA